MNSERQSHALRKKSLAGDWKQVLASQKLSDNSWEKGCPCLSHELRKNPSVGHLKQDVECERGSEYALEIDCEFGSDREKLVDNSKSCREEEGGKQKLGSQCSRIPRSKRKKKGGSQRMSS
jgi:hypothetical protein